MLDADLVFSLKSRECIQVSKIYFATTVDDDQRQIITEKIRSDFPDTPVAIAPEIAGVQSIPVVLGMMEKL